MAGNIKISTDVLTSTAKEIRSINGVMDDKLREINTQMDNLGNTWQSVASEDIRAAMNAMKPKFEEYKEIVEEYAQFLDKTAQAYETTESTAQSNASAFR